MSGLFDVKPLEWVTDDSENYGDAPFSPHPGSHAMTGFNTVYYLSFDHPADDELVLIDGEYVNSDELIEKYGDPSSDEWLAQPYWNVVHMGCDHDETDTVVVSGVTKMMGWVAALRDYRARVRECLK